MSDFNKTILLMPKPWLAWIGLLVAANLVGSLVFIGSLEAKVVITALLIGATIQMWIFGAKGFVRLLGIGHLPWVPMIPWLWTRLDHAEAGSPFVYWLVAVMILDGLSLAIDAADVVRYVKGERKPQLSLETAVRRG
jgi:hypothetical protein